MRTSFLFLSALSLAVGAPAFAQDAMAPQNQMSSSAMKPSPKLQRKAKACNAMSHDAMMKNAGCARLMAAHPDMMKHDSMMSAH